jgi:hypothetical protein
VIISYHSLEDRRVKRLFRDGSSLGEVRGEVAGGNPWNIIFKGAQLPTPEELEHNSRSRSAKLRVAERVDPESARLALVTNKSSRSAAFMGAKQLLKKARREELEAAIPE